MGIHNISGVSDSRIAYVCGNIIKQNPGQCLIVAPSFIEAKRLASDLACFYDGSICLYPGDEETLIHFEARNREPLMERMGILADLAAGEPMVVVVPAIQAIRHLPPAEVLAKAVFELAVGGRLERDDLGSKLAALGYERVPMVYTRAQYSLRGDLLDIYPPGQEYPVRVDFFDTEIESIRHFDPETQRSLDRAGRVRITPGDLAVGDGSHRQRASERIGRRYQNMPERREELLGALAGQGSLQQLESYLPDFYDHPAQLIDYFPEGAVIVADPNKCLESVERYTRQFHEDFKIFLHKKLVAAADLAHFPGKKEYLRIYNRTSLYFCTPYPVVPKESGPLEDTRHLSGRQAISFNGKLDLLERELAKGLEEGYKITLLCSTRERAENLSQYLEKIGLSGRVWIREGQLSSGMVIPEERISIITDGDIFGSQKYRKKRFGSSAKGQPIKSFTDIGVGDYVVHESHGVGRFIGLEQLMVQGLTKDYLKVEYAGRDILYVPVDQMHLIQKYVGAESTAPRINRLSGTEWKNTKARAQAAVEDMAKELLELSAARKAKGGYEFGPDTIWQREFEDSFPFEETSDQLQCIEEIKNDMELPLAMDRLLCGDVGYGKTEVAARAMFKCAAEGKQVAMLVPTTILASQHYHTLKDRFERFPFTVEMLSRFRTESQQQKILSRLRKGSLDILIGTHRLLSEDVAFKDLGLLVIDEEQRFGVQHKEAIKRLRQNVDVLTLSATPIPRTLHMSLLGIRDMSLIEEPPEERYPVQTYVLEQDEDVIREAIERELDRGGQVYVVCNRINGIYRIAEYIDQLVPGRRILVGHGRMREQSLEDVMLNFIAGNGDILIATTIIESGIDIPNVNTIIILDADKFGLSQLYQLRGRVGRSNRLAYAYLMHKKDKVLTEVADKRLRAIREFTEFGAGFKVAMRDLEIRGAGNLLGTEQHGHLVNVGYELYCKMVDQAVRNLQGATAAVPQEETQVDIKVDALIPGTYIEDERLKLDMYKKIAAIGNREEAAAIREELEDRFGDVPAETENLIRVSLLRSLGQSLGMKRITRQGGKTLDQMIDLLLLVKAQENVV